MKGTKLFVVLAVMLLVPQLAALGSDWEEFTSVFDSAGDMSGEPHSAYPWGSHPFALTDDGMLCVGASHLQGTSPHYSVEWKILDANQWSKNGSDWELPLIYQDGLTPSDNPRGHVSAVADSDGNLHLVWGTGNGGGQGAYYHSMFDQGQEEWMEPDLLGRMYEGDSPSWNTQNLAADADEHGGLCAAFFTREFDGLYQVYDAVRYVYRDLNGQLAGTSCWYLNGDADVIFLGQPRVAVGDGGKVNVTWWHDYWDCQTQPPTDHRWRLMHAAVTWDGDTQSWVADTDTILDLDPVEYSIPYGLHGNPYSMDCDENGNAHLLLAYDEDPYDGLYYSLRYFTYAYGGSWGEESSIEPPSGYEFTGPVSVCVNRETVNGQRFTFLDRHNVTIAATVKQLVDGQWWYSTAIKKRYVSRTPGNQWSEWIIIPEGVTSNDYFECYPYLLSQPGGEIALVSILAHDGYGLDDYHYRFRRFAVFPHSKNFFSVPFEPTDQANTNPETVLSALAGHLDLTRWNNATASWIGYNRFFPAPFGGIHLPGAQQGGYILDNNVGSSSASIVVPFHGTASATDTYQISVPLTGKALIGCPYPRPVWWGDVTVIHGSETKTMEEAKQANWLVSKTTWWDAELQSWKTMGLPSDLFVTSRYLLPWHSYWLTTKVDDITLVIPKP